MNPTNTDPFKEPAETMKRKLTGHHHPFPRAHFLTDLRCQSHGQPSALLWLSGGLQWLSPALFIGALNAAEEISHSTF